MDNEALGDEAAQFSYMFINLEPSVQAVVLPQLAIAKEEESWDFCTILEQLKWVYDTPNKIEDAMDHLHNIYQGSDSITQYIARFERMLWEARG